METTRCFQRIELLIHHLLKEHFEINSYQARAYEGHMILKVMKVRGR